MSSVQSPVSDMLVTVKSREVQRATLAAMGGQSTDARKHFLAAAHLELVLAAGDYEQAGDAELARRSRISAASCFWRAGEANDAQAIFDELSQSDPSRASEIQEVVDDLKTA
ncbi:MAG: hypothetical protein WD049_09910 [Candidatus Paceibacterota bacterium]